MFVLDHEGRDLLSVDATNWRAEHAIRPAVVTRKVGGGDRTRHGADTQQVLASVVRTAHQRHVWCADIERHEALTNRAVMREHRRMPVAAGMSKLRAA